jgi:hypothetical protein
MHREASFGARRSAKECTGTQNGELPDCRFPFGIFFLSSLRDALQKNVVLIVSIHQNVFEKKVH